MRETHFHVPFRSASATAFAKLRKGELGFLGVSDTEAALPEMKSVNQYRLAPQSSWNELMGYWQGELANLAKSFVDGCAQVDPISRYQACTHCDLKRLCRVI